MIWFPCAWRPSTELFLGRHFRVADIVSKGQKSEMNSMNPSAPERIRWPAAAFGNLAIMAPMAFAAFLFSMHPDLYQRSVQEDEVLEWITFWNFAAAAGVLGAIALGRIRRHEGWPWFLVGLAAFSLLVALEEISWGQRLFGYRPPTFFLEQNNQLEFNFHNTLGDSLRQRLFLLVCWGYGVVLPIVGAWPRVRGALVRIGVSIPPLEFIPAFASIAVFYQVYPWSHSGEWAEAMLGYAFLFVAVLEGCRRPASTRVEARRHRGLPSWLWLSAAWSITALLGAGTTQIGGGSTAADDLMRSEQARIELAALREDVAAARTRTRCGLHKRIFSLVEAYGMDHLLEGKYASLVKTGLPDARARHFLDPWNSPYWVKHVCSEDHRRRAIFVYSFGPDRKRDSTDWEVVEDDLGAWISRPEAMTRE